MVKLENQVLVFSGARSRAWLIIKSKLSILMYCWLTGVAPSNRVPKSYLTWKKHETSQRWLWIVGSMNVNLYPLIGFLQEEYHRLLLERQLRNLLDLQWNYKAGEVENKGFEYLHWLWSLWNKDWFVTSTLMYQEIVNK